MPGTTARFRDVTEFLGPDHRVLTSSVMGGDGIWQVMMTAHYRRKQ